MIRLDDFLAANPAARLVRRGRGAFPGFAFDSRLVQAGQLFMAVRTAKGDGHDHIASAIAGGAGGVICERAEGWLGEAEPDGGAAAGSDPQRDPDRDHDPHPQPDPRREPAAEPSGAPAGLTVIQVPDTAAAVRAYAAWLIADRKLPVVAVTGSAGKTSAKEFIAHVLEARYRVFRNPGNFNDSYGLPIALGLLEDGHELLVLEMGTDRQGEIAELAAIAPPTVAVVTLVAAAHLDALVDLDGVAREKGALPAALGPAGLAVLNGDDPRTAAMAGRCAAPAVLCHAGEAAGDGSAGVGPPLVEGRPALGLAPAARDQAAAAGAPPDEAWAESPRVGLDGTRFVLRLGGAATAVTIPRLGAHFARAAVMAAVVGQRFGLTLPEITRRLADLPAVPGRLNPLPGRQGSWILDDSYNASPEAVLAGLAVLGQVEAGRRVAVLGDMAELGDLSAESHRRVGRAAAGVVDLLVTKGTLAAGIAEAAREAGLPAERVLVTGRAQDAVDAVLPLLGPETVVLVKGSAVTRMEQVVAGLMAQPSLAPRLLVRQDAAWKQIVVLEPDRPTWVEVDLGALAHNTRRLKDAAGGAALMAVLKADAYGHGAVQAARVVLRHGADRLAVACLSEGAALRAAGIDAPVLVLGYTPAWQAREALRLNLDAAVFDLPTAQAFSRAARDLGRTARLHLKVDTGMHRLGCAPEEAEDLLAALADLPDIQVEGIFTHLACADDPAADGRAATTAQLRAWRALVDRLAERGLRPPLAHALNSAGLLAWPEARGDLVRPGIALYGLAPSAALAAACGPAGLDLRPVLSWRTQVGQLHRLAAGEAVGYGATWRAARPSLVATIPVGYADGFRRAPKGWRQVLVHGRRAPLVGRVSMDQSAVDVTDIAGVRQGDAVTLIGRQGDDEIRADEVAAWLGTISYEVVAGILARVPRLGRDSGEEGA